MENERKDIRTLAKKYDKLQTLMNYINKETLVEQFKKEDSNKASGVDKITKVEYGLKLEEHISLKLMENLDHLEFLHLKISLYKAVWLMYKMRFTKLNF